MNKNSELEESANGFIKFYEGVEGALGGILTSSHEKSIVKQIQQLIKDASKDISPTELAYLESKIAVLNMSLGHLATERVKQSNSAYRWVKWKRAQAWSATRAMVLRDLGKVTVGEMEQELTKQLFSDMMLESHLQGLSDWLTTLHSDVRTFLVSIAHRIRIASSDMTLTPKIDNQDIP